MDYYVYTEADKTAIAYKRCFADAENGRVWLALMRLEDLREQFPDDANVDYAEALIRIDYLGEGLKAGQLCWKASQSEPRLREALFNSVKYAPDRETFLNRISKVIISFPNEQGIVSLQAMELANHADGNLYWFYLRNLLDPELNEKRPGEYAAIIELILNDGGDNIPPEEYAKLLRIRGESLRKIDRNAENRLRFQGEQFLSDERIALATALKEFEENITDPYFRNMETLNLCSAWSMLLGFFDQSIKYADKAIELGGIEYLYPHRNKALSLWGTGKQKESLDLDQETLHKAETAGDEVQAEEIRKAIADHRKKLPENLAEFRPAIEVVLGGAGDVAYQEITAGKSTLEGISSQFQIRLNKIGRRWTVAYVPLMSEMFAFFSPEAAHFIIVDAINKLPDNTKNEILDNISMALRYLAAYGTAVVKHDSVRLIALQILGTLEANKMLKIYRQSILNLSVASLGSPLSMLSELVKKEMSRISFYLPFCIENQPVINNDELEIAHRLIHDRFTLTERELKSNKSNKSGCLLLLAALFLSFLLILNSLIK